MKIHRVGRIGALMVTTAYVRGPKSIAYPFLMIDIGSTYTIIRTKLLEDIGYTPASAATHKRIVTASKYENLPVVKVEQFNCLGVFTADFDVLAHTLPHGIPVDGLLGMDLLRQFPIEIRPYRNEVVLRDN